MSTELLKTCTGFK